jgi:peptidoglycan/LPS O-acetylase OafA/YrhL
MINYRNDIDGLRAYAVIAVIIFHLGFLPNGYLGVDIFFVISGFLISSIIYKDLINGNFSILRFYERRIRRIIPLLLFITTIALILGLFLMLPDDLENLAQSVVASNFSANNVLMLITSSDYWATTNEYKPLMHTWSLGVEEQFYLIYPFLLLLISKISLRYIIYFLLISSLLSICIFFFYGNNASGFYLLHYRFFELSVGGFFAVYFYNKDIPYKYSKNLFFLSVITLLFFLVVPIFDNSTLVFLTTLFTAILLAAGGKINKSNFLIEKFFKNKFIVYVGKISFSLYLWHQLLFAFSRYSVLEKIDLMSSIILVLITFFLSTLTYHFLENPFRNKNILSTNKVIIILFLVFLVSTASALYIYMIGGVYKDYPSVGLSRCEVQKQGYNFFSGQDNIHIHYNEKIRKFDKQFNIDNRRKVLVIGNSFGRDVANIILEHDLSYNVQLSYFDVNRIKIDSNIVDRWKSADVIIFAASKFFSKDEIFEIGEVFGFTVNLDKVYVFGTKDFGYSNGIHFNRIDSIIDFSEYYVNMRDGIMMDEKSLTKEWGKKYVSLIIPIMNGEGKVRIFDKEGRFLSQDTIHLTKAGAIFYSRLLNPFLEKNLR